jgi:AraC-like DNA-binding protein
MTIDRTLLQRQLNPRLLQAGPPDTGAAWHQLPGAEIGFVEVIRNLVADALPDGAPSASRMAKHAGVTLRTFQRRLACEGTTFRDVVEDTRRSLALARIAGGTEALGDISARLGYASPASLSRAVRKWTDRSPRSLRNAIRDPAGP